MTASQMTSRVVVRSPAGYLDIGRHLAPTELMSTDIEITDEGPIPIYTLFRALRLPLDKSAKDAKQLAHMWQTLEKLAEKANEGKAAELPLPKSKPPMHPVSDSGSVPRLMPLDQATIHKFTTLSGRNGSARPLEKSRSFTSFQSLTPMSPTPAVASAPDTPTEVPSEKPRQDLRLSDSSPRNVQLVRATSPNLVEPVRRDSTTGPPHPNSSREITSPEKNPALPRREGDSSEEKRMERFGGARSPFPHVDSLPRVHQDPQVKIPSGTSIRQVESMNALSSQDLLEYDLSRMRDCIPTVQHLLSHALYNEVCGVEQKPPAPLKPDELSLKDALSPKTNPNTSTYHNSGDVTMWKRPILYVEDDDTFGLASTTKPHRPPPGFEMNSKTLREVVERHLRNESASRLEGRTLQAFANQIMNSEPTLTSYKSPSLSNSIIAMIETLVKEGWSFGSPGESSRSFGSLRLSPDKTRFGIQVPSTVDCLRVPKIDRIEIQEIWTQMHRQLAGITKFTACVNAIANSFPRWKDVSDRDARATAAVIAMIELGWL